MEKYVDFKLIKNEDERIYLNGSINIDTIDDDEPEFEFEQNDGTYSSRIPQYWKTRGDDLSDEFEIFVQTIDWDMLKQYLWDFQDDNDAVNFYGDILIINEGAKKSSTIRVNETTKIKLNNLGERGESLDEILNRLIDNYNKSK